MYRRLPHILLPAALCLAGCAGDGGGREVIRADGTAEARTNLSTAAADREVREAAGLIAAGELDDAESRLRRATAADPGNAAARNNLGLIHFARGDLYRAATAFQDAISLAPGRAEPHNNLGLTLESAGRVAEAAGHYAQAHRLDPADARFAGNLARARYRLNERGPELDRLLERVAGDARPAWSAWARRVLATRTPEPAVDFEPSNPSALAR